MITNTCGWAAVRDAAAFGVDVVDGALLVLLGTLAVVVELAEEPTGGGLIPQPARDSDRSNAAKYGSRVFIVAIK